MINTNIDLIKLIPQPDLRNLFDDSELLSQVSVQPLKENSTVVEAEEEKADESTSSSNAETPATNTYSEAEMEEIEAITTEQIEEYARELGQKYYDYEIDLNVMKKIDGINLYYFAVHSGPPNNTVKKYMLGADGVLYNYQSAINGILQMEQ